MKNKIIPIYSGSICNMPTNSMMLIHRANLSILSYDTISGDEQHDPLFFRRKKKLFPLIHATAANQHMESWTVGKLLRTQTLLTADWLIFCNVIYLIEWNCHRWNRKSINWTYEMCSEYNSESASKITWWKWFGYCALNNHFQRCSWFEINLIFRVLIEDKILAITQFHCYTPLLQCTLIQMILWNEIAGFFFSIQCDWYFNGAGS